MNDSGYLEQNDLFDILELKGNSMVERIIRVVDEKNDGCISFYEFVNGLTSLTRNSNPIHKYRFVFKIYDLNGDDYISNEDLFKMIKLVVKKTLGDVFIQQLVDRTILEVDLERDSEISFEEFVTDVKNTKI